MIAALPDGGPVDFARLRRDRRERLLSAMAAAELDALMLGRPANVTFASGARQLWTSGARPFAPTCVVVRETSAVHVLSTWDEGIPDEIAHDQLFGLTWNPAILVRNLAAIPGLAAARRVGTDSSGPGFGPLLEAVAPRALQVDAGPALTGARHVKSGDEIACIQTACAGAEAALTSLIAELDVGVSERELVAAYLAAIASMGAPTPASEGIACGTPRRGPVRFRQLATGHRVAKGELVVLNPGALYAGYEGGIGRTVPAGAQPSGAQRRLAGRCRGVLDGLIERCRPGTTGAELLDVAGTGPGPVAYGLGLGVEPPIIGPGIGGAVRLAAGSVLSVQAWAAEDGVGGVLEREVVHVTDDGPRLLSRYTRGPWA